MRTSRQPDPIQHATALDRPPSQKKTQARSIGDEPDELIKEVQDRFARAHLVSGDIEFGTLVARIVGYLDAPTVGLDLPPDVRATAFMQRVWMAFQDVPAGEPARILRPRSAR